jgi:hypothetical protein
MTVIEIKITKIRAEWLRRSQVLGKYNIGKDQLRNWRDEGIVKISPTSEKNILYRVSDIERAIDDLAEGRIPESYNN